MRLRAIRDNILCINGDFDDLVTESGLIVKSTAGKSEGITPRWFEIFELGPEADKELAIGQWVYVAYGRWTEGLECEDERFPEGKTKVWKVDPEGCLAVQDEKPNQTLNYNKSTAFDGSYHNVLDN
jgi:hypothetical protein|tara:strand:+ start:181 stop:558 length:378 start_codon:yes stop_codon:yes gene_type:complete